MVLRSNNYLLLHDRSGLGTRAIKISDLGVTWLGTPMAFTNVGDLLIPGSLPKTDAGAERSGLLSCRITEMKCQILSTLIPGVRISALAVQPMTGTLLLADAAASSLIKLNRAGDVLAQATVTLPARPTLRLQDGLLFINSTEGPAIDVFRYDDSAFGKQLDQVLLLPPTGISASDTRVADFISNGDRWWVHLIGTTVDNSGIYRFDRQWNYIDHIAYRATNPTLQLGTLLDKTLVLDSHQIAIQRFSRTGVAEAPLVSTLLTELAEKASAKGKLTEILWRLALGAAAVVFLAALILGGLHQLRYRVYKSARERGADPVEPLAENMRWVAPAPHRARILRNWTIAYAGLVLTVLLLGAWAGTDRPGALLLALAGPAIALLLMYKSPIGHVGADGTQLLLVDHTGMYHLGSDARIQYRGPFLIIDDVVVYTGHPLLPAFDPQEVNTIVEPLASCGIKVDGKTVAIKLLQRWHPLALALLSTVGALLLSLLIIAS